MRELTITMRLPVARAKKQTRAGYLELVFTEM